MYGYMGLKKVVGKGRFSLVGVCAEAELAAAAALEGKPELVAIKVVGGYWGTNTVELCTI